MTVPERAIAGVQLIGVDLQRVALEDGADQREARVLVPAAGLVEVRVGEEERDASTTAMRSWRGVIAHVTRSGSARSRRLHLHDRAA